MKATIYKISTTDAETKHQVSLRYWTHIPENNCYYRHELLGEYEVDLDDDIEIVKQKCTGIPTFWRGKEYLEFCTVDDAFCLISEKGVMKFQPTLKS